jgi:signal transduction histidine kinase
MARTARPRGMRGSSRVTWNEIEQLRRRVRELELMRERLSRLYFSQVEAGKARMEKLHRLLEVVTQLNSTLDLESLLTGIVRAVQATLGFRVVLLRALEPSSGRLRARAFAGLPSEAVARLESEDVSLDTFLSWLSDEFRVGRSYFISHTTSFSSHLPEGVRPALGTREPWEWHEDDVLFVPLYQKSGEIVGYLSVDDPVDRLVPSRETIELLEVFANHVVVALENARLYQSLEEHSKSLEQANTRLGELTRLKSNFLSAISHELRTPLTSIRAYTDSLRDASPHGGAGGDPEAWNRSLNVLSDESARLEALIDSVLSFSALESGVGPQAAAVDLSGLIRECTHLLSPAARTKGVALDTDLPKKKTSLQGDRELLKQLLLQLGGNAIKFTPQGGRVTIGVTPEDQALRLWVKDTGIGIPAKERERIFERFYQVDGGLSRHYGGTGLGLAICKSVAEWHGGDISVTSRQGKGSCFTAVLPLQPPARADVWTASSRRREGTDQVLSLAVEMTAHVLEAPCVVLLIAQGDGDLVAHASVGLGKDEVRSIRLRPGEGVAGLAFAKAELVASEDAESDPRFLGHRREPYRTGQVLAAPVRLGDRVAGAIVVSHPEASEGQTPADNQDGVGPSRSVGAQLALLGQLAEQVGTVLARVERMRQGEAEAVVAAETLKTLLVHLRRDRRNGAERARYAGLVARVLGLDEAESSQVEFAALVADIALSRPETGATEPGQPVSEAEAMQAIAVTPPGELVERLEKELDRHEVGAEPDEEDGYRRHPEKAVEILSPLGCEPALREMILGHHEWLNGGGYPKGWSGNRIPVGARVLSVVDRFESLLLGRVGRPGVSVEEAVEELRRLGGQRFDPRVVEALVDVLEKEGRLAARKPARPRAA